MDAAIGLGTLRWLSPLADDDWTEYRDHAFLDRLGVTLSNRTLSDFWPFGGPVWDGLAVTEAGVCVLVEAKAHVNEMASHCAASATASLALIESALDETKAAFGVNPDRDWLRGYYQYANRLAHAYLFNELNHVPAVLVFLNFVGDRDMSGPASRGEWESAISEVHTFLGLTQLPHYVRDAFVDVDGAV